MIISFADNGTEDVYDGNYTTAARRACPADLRKVALRKLDALNRAESLKDLRVPPGNRLEPLSGNREGQHSIRINQQYRICFRWTQNGPAELEIVDYH
jgi:proteic killer suppression protein